MPGRTRMNDQDRIDWTLIDRYLAGECDEADERAVQNQQAADPAFGQALEAARIIRAAGSDQAPDWDLSRVWRRVARGTAVAQDPVEVRVPRPPRRRRAERARTPVVWGRLAAAAVISLLTPACSLIFSYHTRIDLVGSQALSK